ncbi:hypothetical protein [Fodinicola acaciae]|uniref:hypothetical protein n=1 Tax=Fodinicola acaciae TaxID=2681555 RepID=UPI0013D5F2FB|nr:hypothetical protein [Fodinicola acaciae]
MTYFPSLSKVPPKRAHTLTEPRPVQLHLGWGLLMLCWLCMLALSVYSLFHDPKTSGSTVFWVVFWALAVSAIILRGWWGGPRPWVYMKLLAQILGPLFLIGGVILAGMAVVSFGVQPQMAVYLLPTLVCGGSLLAAGILLSTRPVRAFYEQPSG